MHTPRHVTEGTQRRDGDGSIELCSTSGRLPDSLALRERMLKKIQEQGLTDLSDDCLELLSLSTEVTHHFFPSLLAVLDLFFFLLSFFFFLLIFFFFFHISFT